MKNKSTLRKLFEIRAKSRRHYRLLSGRIYKEARRTMSTQLAESVVRTWERKQSTTLPY